VEQAAIMLSLSVRSIWILIKDGRIKHTRFGTRVIVSVRSLNEFVNGKQESAVISESDDESQENIE
jgi:excisionase family DNA binding protein